MYKNLNTGAIGVRATLTEQIDLARRHGFAGIDIPIVEAQAMADAHGVAAVKELLAAANLRPGGWGFPVEFRKDEETWRRGLEALPKQAALAAELGCFRTYTWILPAHDEYSFAEFFDLHVNRMRPAAQILKDHGHRFGLEFVGPKTVRDPRKHLFVHTMDGMLALGAAIGTGNVGLLLDIYHLHTSRGFTDDVRKLSNHEIVYVHVNDAQPDKPVDELLDLVRALPAETGVLDIVDFLHALRAIGYDGPLTAEPFSQRLRELPADQAVAETAAAMNKIWAMAELD
jgi:sugar phosphate isomerase/epimerase